MPWRIAPRDPRFDALSYEQVVSENALLRAQVSMLELKQSVMDSR